MFAFGVDDRHELSWRVDWLSGLGALAAAMVRETEEEERGGDGARAREGGELGAARHRAAASRRSMIPAHAFGVDARLRDLEREEATRWTGSSGVVATACEGQCRRRLPLWAEASRARRRISANYAT